VIAVTGATGHVGGLLAQELARRAERMKLLVRDPSRAPSLPGAEVVMADYGDPASVAAALDEGDRVFMVSLHEGPDERVPHHRSFVEAAAAAGVGQIAYLSFVNAGPDAIFIHARSHGATEQMLRESGVAWTSIRNGMYADHVGGWFDAEGVAREPVGEGRISFSYRPELAEAIAVVLTEPGHENRVYDVTTPESVTLGELAAIASEVTGAAYRYEPQTRDEWEAKWRARGKDGWELESGLSSFDAHVAGELDVVTDDFRLLTGKEPLSIRDVIARELDTMPLRA